MTSSDWAILIGIVAAVGVPLGAGCIAVWGRLGLIIYQLGENSKAQAENQKEIRELWRVHNHQEGRLFMQDRVLVELMKKMSIDLSSIDFQPKERPNYHGQPD